MMRNMIWVIIFLFLHATGMAQGGGWVYHTAAIGLPSNQVQTIFQDSIGYIWVGTDKGIGRYDGETWQAFAPSFNNRIWSFREDKNGLWAYGPGGVWLYDGTDLKNLIEGRDLFFENGLYGLPGLFEDSQKTVWAYGNKGVWRYNENPEKMNENRFEKVLEGEPIAGLFKDSQNTLWAYGEDVWRYNGTRFEKVLERDFPETGVLFEDSQNTLWASGQDGVWRYNGTRFERVLEGNFALEGGLFKDSQNTLWAYEEDIWRYNGTRFEKVLERGWALNGGLWEDHQKTLWVYGRGGVLRYNGTRFEKALGGEQIAGLFEDSQKTLWAYGFGDVLRYNGTRFKKVLKAERVNGLFEDSQKTLWVYGNGLWQYNGTHFENVLEGRGIAGLFEDRQKTLWAYGSGMRRTLTRIGSKVEEGQKTVWTYGGGVWQYDRTQYETVLEGEIQDHFEDQQKTLWVYGLDGVWQYNGSRFEKMVKEKINGLFEDSQKTLWAYGWGGVWRYNGTRFENVLKGGRIIKNGWFEDHQNTLWVYGVDGVWQYNGSRFERMVKEEIEGLFEDSQKTLWAYGEGLWRYKGTRFERMLEGQIRNIPRHNKKRFEQGAETQNQGAIIEKLLEDHPKTLWVYGRGEGWRYNGTRFEKMWDRGIDDLFKDGQNTLWAYGFGGVWRYNGKDFELMLDGGIDGPLKQGIAGLFEDSQKTLWAYGTEAGVWRYNGSSFDEIPVLEQSGKIKGMKDHQNKLWAYGDNVWRYNGGRFERMLKGGAVIKSGPLEETQKTLWVFEDSRKTLWVYGNRGVWRYNGNTLVNLLPDEDVFEPFEERGGTLGFRTEQRGVLRLDGTAIQRITSNDGLVSDDISEIYEDPKGNLWFVSPQGLTRKTPGRTAPRIDLIRVKTDKAYDRKYNEELTIQPFVQGTRVTFSYQGISFKRGGRLQYLYRLEGVDKDWQSPTTEKSVDYPDLKPGRYTFWVKAIDRDLIDSEPKSITFVVKRYWWFRPEFVVPIGSGMLAVMVLLFVQSRKLIRVELRLRNEIRSAQETQKSLLPKTHPQIAGFEIEGFSLSAAWVGGDFYHYIENDNNVLIIVVDTAGHGLSAAMQAQAVSLLLAQVVDVQNIDKPDAILSQLNRILYQSSRGSNLVTSTSVCLAYIDRARRTLSVSRAGDCRAYRITDGGIEEIFKTVRGNDLGLWPPSESEYSIQHFDLSPEDFVFICSDGLIDAVSGDQNVFTQIDTSSAKSAVESIQRSHLLSGKAIDDEKTDDITVVCIKVLKTPEERDVI